MSTYTTGLTNCLPSTWLNNAQIKLAPTVVKGVQNFCTKIIFSCGVKCDIRSLPSRLGVFDTIRPTPTKMVWPSSRTDGTGEGRMVSQKKIRGLSFDDC